MLNPAVGQWAGTPGNPPCHPLAGWKGPSQPSLSLPICAGKDRMGFLSLGWRVAGKDSSSRGEPQGPDGSTGEAPHSRAVLVLGDGTWPRGCLSLTPTAFCVFKCLTSSHRSLALEGPLASPLPCWSGSWVGGSLAPSPPNPILPPPHCRNLRPGSSNPQSSSLGESPSECQRGLGSAEGCGGDTVGLSGGDPMGTGGRGGRLAQMPRSLPWIPSQLGTWPFSLPPLPPPLLGVRTPLLL